MYMDEGAVGDFGTDPIFSKATKGLVVISMPEIPNDLPETAGAHPTKHERRSRLEQSGEILGKLSEIVDTV
jgi:hypothetical protein